MIKYMTMREAFECGDDDIPFIDDQFNSEMDFTKRKLLDLSDSEGFRPCPSIKLSLSNKWQIKKSMMMKEIQT